MRSFLTVPVIDVLAILTFLLTIFNNVMGHRDDFYKSACLNDTWLLGQSVLNVPSDRLPDTIQNGRLKLNSCGHLCCLNSQCIVALYLVESCILLKCGHKHLCLSKTIDSSQILATVFVRTNWILNSNTTNVSQPSVLINNKTKLLSNCDNESYCENYEICIPMSNTSTVCSCQNKFEKENGFCVPKSTGSVTSAHQTIIEASATTEAPKCCDHLCKPLIVSAASKDIHLPDNSVTLSAYVLGESDQIKFNWSPVSHEKAVNIGTMTDTSSPTLKLTDLKEGVYGFKVVVRNNCGEYGEAYCNVTVLPAARINKPPIAKISVPSQIIQLPQTTAVLDGSPSTDDDKIVSYRWDVLKSPILYQAELPQAATVRLENLIVGNYSVQLTVEDSDNETNSSIANLTVIPIPDYPPTAVAGQDVIIYLPQNNITLNGNQSRDDKGIESWEWIKDASGEDKAVDMQNTRTPYLQLSGLEEGVYKFILKVTDTSHNTATDDINVFVKRPSSEVPIANAGDDMTLNFPVDTITLNGSNSKSVNPIIRWKWYQISGPSNVSIIDEDKPVALIRKAKVGEYKFGLDVFTEKASGTDNVTIILNAAANRGPEAIVGKDTSVQLPQKEVRLDGSQSNDDYGIVRWKWTRDGSSLSAGQVIGKSDEEPVLRLINLIPGRYLFKLRVEDKQGLASEASSSLIVNEDPHYKDHIRMVLNTGIQDFTESQKELTAKRISLLLSDAVDIEVVEVYGEEFTNKATLVFMAKGSSDPKQGVVNGLQVVKQVKARLRNDVLLLGFNVLKLDTLLCQNECSGHGVCDEATRTCVCETFWMENPFRRYCGDYEINCDWSILYVVIVLLVCLVVGTAVIWGGAYACRRQKTPVRKRQRYSLLRGNDQSDKKTVNSPRIFKPFDSDLDSESPEEIVLVNGVFGSKNLPSERTRDISDGLESLIPNSIS